MKQSTEQQKDPRKNNETSKGSGHKQKNFRRKKSGLLVFIVLFFGIVVLSLREPVTTIDCTPDIIASGPDVIMLGAWWCRYCYQAKKYFQRNDIHYCEYDMESTTIGKRLYQKHGSGTIPILLIGQYRLSGFNEQRIESALSLLNKKSRQP